MTVIAKDEAQQLILNTFNEFSRLLRHNKDNRPMPFHVVSLLSNVEDLERILAMDRFRNELFDGLSTESYDFLLRECSVLADLYSLSTRNKLRGKRIGDRLDAITGAAPRISDLMINTIPMTGLEQRVHTNSSNVSTLIPTSGPDQNPGGKFPGMASLFSARITTIVVTYAGSDKISVFSHSTRGPALYRGTTANTIATLTINGVNINSATLEHRPAIISDMHMSLGFATFYLPAGMVGNISVTTETIWKVPHASGAHIPIHQNVTVRVSD